MELLIADSNNGTIETFVAGKEPVKRVFGSSARVVQEVVEHMALGWELKSSSGGVYTLVRSKQTFTKEADSTGGSGFPWA